MIITQRKTRSRLPSVILLAATACALAACTGELENAAPPANVLTFTIPGFDVPVGREIQRCYYYKVPSDVDLDIATLRMDTTAGSHHFQVYVSDVEDYPDGASEECFRIVDFERWHMVFASQSATLEWGLPQGVAVRLNAGQQLMIQTHYINTGALKTPGGVGGGTLTMVEAPPGSVKTHMGAIFGVNYDIHLPPHQKATADANCVFPREGKIAALTGHYHFFGKNFRAKIVDATGANDRDPFYEVAGFNELRFDTWPEAQAPVVPANSAINWHCDYENTSDKELVFGAQEVDHEHCNMFAFYYPAEPQEFRPCRNNDRDGDNRQDNGQTP